MALKKVLLFAIGVALTIYVVGFFGLFEVLAALAGADLALVGSAVLIQIAVLGLIVLRLKILTYGWGYLSLLKTARITMTGMVVSMVTPIAKIGGEPLKIYMLRQNIGSAHASVAVAVDSLMEVFSSIFVIFVVTVLFIGAIPQPFFTAFVLFLVISGLILGTVLKVLLTPRWMGRIIDWTVKKISRFQEVEEKDYTKLFHDAFNTMLKDRKKLAGVFAISIFSKILEIIKIWIIFLALGLALPSQTVIIAWAILLVLMFVPWLPGSLGLVEFGVASALVLLGVPGPVGASGVLVERFMSFWLVLLIGFLALSSSRKMGELPSISKSKIKISEKEKRS